MARLSYVVFGMITLFSTTAIAQNYDYQDGTNTDYSVIDNTTSTDSTVNSTNTNTNTNSNTNVNTSTSTNTNTNSNTNVNTNNNTSVNTNTNNNTSVNTNTNTNTNNNSTTYTGTNTSNSTNNNTNTNTSTNSNTNATTYTGTSTSNNTSNNTNSNTNTSTSSSTVSSTSDSTVDQTVNQNSVNSNTNVNTNSSTSESSSTSEVTTSNENQNVNRNYSETEVKSPPPSAIAPSIGSSYSQDLCTTGVSGAVQTQIIGLSGGKAVRDMNCERIKLSKTLYDMGMKVAAVSTMCQDERVWKAMMMAGTPCPFEGKIGPAAQMEWAANPRLIPDNALDEVKIRRDQERDWTPLWVIIGLFAFGIVL